MWCYREILTWLKKLTTMSLLGGSHALWRGKSTVANKPNIGMTMSGSSTLKLGFGGIISFKAKCNYYKYCKIIHICAVIKMNIRYAYHRVVPKKLLVWLYVCVFPRIISDCRRNTTKIPTELITSESPLHKYIIPAETKSVAFILFEPLNKLA